MYNFWRGDKFYGVIILIILFVLFVLGVLGDLRRYIEEVVFKMLEIYRMCVGYV